jgi:hypothetical protein
MPVMLDNERDDLVAENNDGPPDELEVGEVIEAEVVRLVHHPREEAARLKEVAADGEQGSTPFIEIALVARWVIPFVVIMIGVALLVYFKA